MREKRARLRERESKREDERKGETARESRRVCVLPVSKHKAVAGAIHGFHAPFLPFHVKGEHSVFVVLGVSCVCVCVCV